MAKLCLIHLLSVVIAICLFQTVASASVSVSILSPSIGAAVQPGQSVSVQAQALCNNNFLNLVTITVNGSNIYTQNYGAWSTENFCLATSSFTVPTNATAGSMYTIMVEATQNGGDTTVYWDVTYVLVGSADTTPPSYSGTAGIKSVERIDGESADIEWYQATDNVTPSANIEYEIYYNTVQANVFTSGIKKTVTGLTSTTITGLTRTSSYYVGVRAVDSAGIRETNSRTLFLDLPLNAVGPDAWAMYE